MKTKKSLGSALILTTILLFVILGMVVSLTYVTVMEQKMSSKTKSSVTSFYNAESGIEWILNKIASNSGTNISSTFEDQWDDTNSLVNCPSSFGDNNCKIYLLDQDGNVIDDSTVNLSEIKAVRSVGTQGDQTQRAIEAAVAGTTEGGYSYIAFGTTSCESGYSVAYIGEAMSLLSTASTTPTDIICSHTTIPVSAESGYWANGKYDGRLVVSCAVCVK